MAAGSSGCGSILYPERVGQPRTGPLDWKVVALDGVGLLLFFVPGIVAFAVDFYNGTIFLPPHGYSMHSPAAETELVSLDVEPEQLSQSRVEEVVSAHVQQEVTLRPGAYQMQPLSKIDHFWAKTRELQANLLG